MADEDTVKGFARLEALLQVMTEAERHGFEVVDTRLQHLGNAVKGMEGRLTELEQHRRETDRIISQVRGQAETAGRKSSESLHEIHSIGDGLSAHMAKLETARAEEVRGRERAQAAHAGRFKQQGEAIAALATRVEKGVRVRIAPGQWIAILSIAIGAAVTCVTIAADVAKAYIEAHAAPSALSPPR